MPRSSSSTVLRASAGRFWAAYRNDEGAPGRECRRIGRISSREFRLGLGGRTHPREDVAPKGVEAGSASSLASRLRLGLVGETRARGRSFFRIADPGQDEVRRDSCLAADPRDASGRRLGPRQVPLGEVGPSRAISSPAESPSRSASSACIGARRRPVPLADRWFATSRSGMRGSRPARAPPSSLIAARASLRAAGREEGLGVELPDVGHPAGSSSRSAWPVRATAARAALTKSAPWRLFSSRTSPISSFGSGERTGSRGAPELRYPRDASFFFASSSTALGVTKAVRRFSISIRIDRNGPGFRRPGSPSRPGPSPGRRTPGAAPRCSATGRR